MDTYKLRELCIAKNWFTGGTNTQYKKLFQMLDARCSVRDLAVAIWLCSDNVTIDEVIEILEERIREYCV